MPFIPDRVARNSQTRLVLMVCNVKRALVTLTVIILTHVASKIFMNQVIFL